MGSDLFLITNWSKQVSKLINNIKKMDNTPHSINDLFSLEGKLAVITGGGGHLCSSIAEGLAMAGASIAVIDMREEKALKVANEIKNKYEVNAIPIKADVTDETSLKSGLDQILKEFSTVDILINGAGKNSPKLFLDISLEEWNEVMNSQRSQEQCLAVRYLLQR